MTATTSRIKRPATLDPGLLGRHPLAGYFAIALAGTWLAVLPLLLGADGLDLFGYRFGDAGSCSRSLAHSPARCWLRSPSPV